MRAVWIVFLLAALECRSVFHNGDRGGAFVWGLQQERVTGATTSRVQWRKADALHHRFLKEDKPEPEDDDETDEPTVSPTEIPSSLSTNTENSSPVPIEVSMAPRTSLLPTIGPTYYGENTVAHSAHFPHSCSLIYTCHGL